jgi:hypothetical protein
MRYQRTECIHTLALSSSCRYTASKCSERITPYHHTSEIAMRVSMIAMYFIQIL